MVLIYIECNWFNIHYLIIDNEEHLDGTNHGYCAALQSMTRALHGSKCLAVEILAQLLWCAEPHCYASLLPCSSYLNMSLQLLLFHMISESPDEFSLFELFITTNHNWTKSSTAHLSGMMFSVFTILYISLQYYQEVFQIQSASLSNRYQTVIALYEPSLWTMHHSDVLPQFSGMRLRWDIFSSFIKIDYIF